MKTYFGQKENVLRNMLVYVLLISIVITMLRPLSLYAAEKNYNVDCKAYEFSKGDYPFSSSEPVEVMSFGSKSLGSFEISGDMSEPDEFNGVPAFGVESGRLKFSYKYEGTFNNSEGDVILVEDKGKKVDNLKLDARIDKGVLIVQKSDDGKEWEDAVNPITNIFHENKNPLLLVNFYTTDGKDIAKGTFYRVIIAYETQEKKGSYGVFGLIQA